MIVKTGIEGLDALLHGGIPEGSAVVVEGPPGSGKTILGMQYVWHGANAGDPSLFLVIQELPEQLHRQMKSFGWNTKELEQKRLLQVIGMDPQALHYDIMETEGLLESILDAAGCKRLVLDGIGMFACLSSQTREHRAVLYTLRNMLQRKGITALLIAENTAGHDAYRMEHYMFDGIIQLRSRKVGRQTERTVEVVKMRGTPIMEGEAVYQLTHTGIHIEEGHSSSH